MSEETTTLYCYVHPDRETSLRCNRCERPICVQCAVRTPIGYRCKECVREQQQIFNTAEWYDYFIGFGAAAVLSLIASILLVVISGFIGFFMWFVSFAIAGAAGTFIANITQSALRKRRSKQLFWLTAAGVVAGAIPVILFLLLTGSYFSIIWQGLYLFVATPTVYARISGFQFSR
ncbi:MAG: hypothetical protein JW963_23560 [Anaerolineales bacterium]|nr:hypothetical protein [Anaerolineales bacterium]